MHELVDSEDQPKVLAKSNTTKGSDPNPKPVKKQSTLKKVTKKDKKLKVRAGPKIDQ